MVGITKISNVKLSIIALILTWIAVIGLDAHIFGVAVPMPLLITIDALIASATVLVGLIWILRGPGYYKAMKFGETVGREKERCRHRRATSPPNQRVGATTG